MVRSSFVETGRSARATFSTNATRLAADYRLIQSGDGCVAAVVKSRVQEW